MWITRIAGNLPRVIWVVAWKSQWFYSLAIRLMYNLEKLYVIADSHTSDTGISWLPTNSKILASNSRKRRPEKMRPRRKRDTRWRLRKTRYSYYTIYTHLNKTGADGFADRIMAFSGVLIWWVWQLIEFDSLIVYTLETEELDTLYISSIWALISPTIFSILYLWLL